MGRVAVLYATAIGLLIWSFAIASGDSSRLFEGLTPLNRPLTAGGMRSTFTTVWDGPHEVIITLPTSSGRPEVDAFVKAASEHVGNQDPPTWDLTWKVFEKGSLIGSGSGRGGAQGVMPGAKFCGFMFGTFPAKAGGVYDVSVDVGLDFEPLLRSSASVQIGVASASASEGLAIGEALRRPAAWFVGIVGAGVMVAALWYQHFLTGRPTTR